MAALDRHKLGDNLVYLTANRDNIQSLTDAVRRNTDHLETLRPLVLLEMMVLLEAIKGLKEADEARSVNSNWGSW